MARVNAAGPFFLSHTSLAGRYTLRVAIGNIRTGPEHLDALAVGGGDRGRAA